MIQKYEILLFAGSSWQVLCDGQQLAGSTERLQLNTESDS